MSEATSIQTWGSYDPEEAERDKKETETKGTFFKIKQPKTSLRFLPPRKGQKNPFVKTYQHYVELVEGDERTNVKFNCPRKMLKAFCPLCVKAEKLRATGREEDRQRAYDLFPRLRVYSAVIDRNNEDAGVQIFPFGQKIFTQLLNIREDGDFTNPTDSGFDIAIIKKGSTKNDTEYGVKAYRKNTALTEDKELFNEWIGALPDLVQYAKVPNQDEVKQIIDQAMSAGRGEGEEDEAPRGRSERGGRERSGGREQREERRETGRRERGGAIDTEGETVTQTSGEEFWGDEEADDDLPY